MVMLILGVTVSNQTSGAGICTEEKKAHLNIKAYSNAKLANLKNKLKKWPTGLR
jgi:hypothetical protein